MRPLSYIEKKILTMSQFAYTFKKVNTSINKCQTAFTGADFVAEVPISS